MMKVLIPIQEKILFRSMVVISCIVLLCMSVQIFNALWSGFRTPPDFRDSRWRGSWDSETSFAHGRLIAKMPDPIPRDEAFDVEVWVYYDVWSFTYPGCYVRFDMEGLFQTEGAGDGDGNTNPSAPIMNFKSKPSNFNFSVDYAASINNDSSLIVGGYTSSPFDMGTFVLKKL